MHARGHGSHERRGIPPVRRCVHVRARYLADRAGTDDSSDRRACHVSACDFEKGASEWNRAGRLGRRRRFAPCVVGGRQHPAIDCWFIAVCARAWLHHAQCCCRHSATPFDESNRCVHCSRVRRFIGSAGVPVGHANCGGIRAVFATTVRLVVPYSQRCDDHDCACRAGRTSRRCCHHAPFVVPAISKPGVRVLVLVPSRLRLFTSLWRIDGHSRGDVLQYHSCWNPRDFAYALGSLRC